MSWTFETPNDLLLLAYRAVHREGWEDGPTEGEVWEAVVDHLSNEGLDPSTPGGEQRCAYLTNPPLGHGPAMPYREEVMRVFRATGLQVPAIKLLRNRMGCTLKRALDIFREWQAMDELTAIGAADDEQAAALRRRMNQERSAK